MSVADQIYPFLDQTFHIAWSRLTAEAIERDIGKALEGARSNIETLCGEVEEDELTFENTLLALEDATEELSYAWGLLGHLDSVRNNEAQRDRYNAMLPEVTQFFSSIPLNEKLWRKIKAYSKTDEAKHLQGAKKRLLEETISDFVRNGADLSSEKKIRLEAVQNELAQKTQKFSENVLDSTNAWELVLDSDKRLEGLPESALGVLRAEALAKEIRTEDEPKYRITLKAPCFIPILEYAADESLRREVWEASVTVGNIGEYDNTDLIREILLLRQEKAELLGKKQFADQVLENRMAGDGDTALSFVEDLADRTRSFFQRELSELADYRKESEPSWNGSWEPWDFSFWCEKLRKARHDFDDEELRPFFSIDQVLEGMFRLTEKVFGFVIKERKTCFCEKEATCGSEDEVEVWHPEVKFYELYDQESEQHLGSFYADWHPREEKRGGAWMNYLRTGIPSSASENREPHLGLICGNLTPSSPDKPALLSHREVETVFHEFGHLLHHLLGEVEIKSLNGVNVVWDFVELPSQIMENFCWSRDSLDFFARHYETGEVIPEKLFQKMQGARSFQSGIAQMRQLAFGKMDLELHINHHSSLGEKDLDKLNSEILEGYMIPFATDPPSMARRFSHLFSSPTAYAAGYYSYKWAEVLDADAFTRFAEAGVISESVGREFREKILSQGNSKNAGELYQDFMGRDPDLQALLVRSGLVS